MQSLIDQAEAQYAIPARPQSLGPITITLPGDLTYTLDGPLEIGAGVRLRGVTVGGQRPALVSVGESIDVQAWAQAAHDLAAITFTVRVDAPYTFEEVPFHHLRCKPYFYCTRSEVDAAIAALDGALRTTYQQLCPDDDCPAASHRYLELVRARYPRED